MKRSILAVMILAMGVILSACGGNNGSNSNNSSSGGGNGSPSDAVKGYLTAVFAGNAIDSYLCTSDSAGSAAIKQGMNTIKTSLSASGATIDVSGLTYTVANQTSDTADVKVAGTLKMTVGGNSSDAPFQAMTVKTKNESGWKVCGMGQ